MFGYWVYYAVWELNLQFNQEDSLYIKLFSSPLIIENIAHKTFSTLKFFIFNKNHLIKLESPT
jgi:hypothetical protein